MNMSGATPTVLLDIALAFDKILQLKSHNISSHIFSLIFSFFSNRLDVKSFQKSPMNTRTPEGSVLT